MNQRQQQQQRDGFCGSTKWNSANIPGPAQTFPIQLYSMLTEAEIRGFDDIVSWLPCGRMFKVYQKDAFTVNIMPHYFNQTKYKSFQRQLNAYGFHRFLRGPFKDAVAHPTFVKDHPENCQMMMREKVKRRVHTNQKSSDTTSEDEPLQYAPSGHSSLDDIVDIAKINSHVLFNKLSGSHKQPPFPLSAEVETKLGCWSQAAHGSANSALSSTSNTDSCSVSDQDNSSPTKAGSMHGGRFEDNEMPLPFFMKSAASARSQEAKALPSLFEGVYFYPVDDDDDETSVEDRADCTTSWSALFGTQQQQQQQRHRQYQDTTSWSSSNHCTPYFRASPRGGIDLDTELPHWPRC